VRDHPLAGPDYVGRKKCGCFTVWVSGSLPPAVKAKHIAHMKRDGLEVFPCEPDWARYHVRECHCEDQGRLDFDPPRLGEGGGGGRCTT